MLWCRNWGSSSTPCYSDWGLLVAFRWLLSLFHGSKTHMTGPLIGTTRHVRSVEHVSLSTSPGLLNTAPASSELQGRTCCSEERTGVKLKKHDSSCAQLVKAATGQLDTPNQKVSKYLQLDSTCIRSVQFSSVTQSCPTLCNPMNRSMPGLPVHHQLLEFTQSHIHRVSDAIQPSHPLSSPSPPAPTPSQHQSLFH